MAAAPRGGQRRTSLAQGRAGDNAPARQREGDDVGGIDRGHILPLFNPSPTPPPLVSIPPPHHLRPTSPSTCCAPAPLLPLLSRLRHRLVNAAVFIADRRAPRLSCRTPIAAHASSSSCCHCRRQDRIADHRGRVPPPLLAIIVLVSVLTPLQRRLFLKSSPKFLVGLSNSKSQSLCQKKVVPKVVVRFSPPSRMPMCGAVIAS
ncbi:uncharacterized protein LOC107304349 [Oryza brachyantha]|uniref:uncharacterized protein LOC107304349 n=1 Tax=Oryza brachyantha TaxID=4533 RepID=UPI001AD98C23|nr:uncharacterized protein LOC107304349 [Oryza brachyantha]